METPDAPRQAAEPGFRFGPPVFELYRDPAGYDPGPDLHAAVQVALLLGMPLLLTGAPGCGKTSVAEWLALKLGLGKPLVFNVKSTSIGRDLLYRYDDLARFRDAQPRGTRRPLHAYLTLSALGEAILLSTAGDAVLPSTSGAPSALRGLDLLPGAGAAGFRQRRVVLIDEIDKAPRDTPNDLLLELEGMRFPIPELDIKIEGSADLRPVVVITSNAEKNLPEPFLRRCVFHYIEAPNERRRRDIVRQRKHPFEQRGVLFEQALRFFGEVSRLSLRKPGTAELLAWLTDLEDRVARHVAADPGQQPPARLKDLLQDGLGVLAKTRDELEDARRALEHFE